MLFARDQSEKNGNWIYAFILCSVFYVFISMPLLFQDYRPTEAWNIIKKAVLRPRLRIFRDCQIDFERYFNEHFGFRNGLVRLNSLINIRIFNASPSERIVLGKDSWLFYDDPEDGVSLRDFRGQARLSDSDLQGATNKVVELRRNLEKRGIKLIIVVAPSKHTIYPEYLPPHDWRTRPGANTRLDQLADAFKDFGTDFIDLRKTLLLKKDSPYLLYYGTDTHWNAWGAFVAYEEIMKRVMGKGLKVDMLRTSEFRIESHGGWPYGDIARILNMAGLLPDSEVVMQQLNGRKATNVQVKYISDSGRETEAREVKGSKLAKLLMFRDSFATAMIPYLSESFSRSVYIWTSDVNLSVVEDEKPDLVILEMAERLVGSLVNDAK